MQAKVVAAVSVPFLLAAFALGSFGAYQTWLARVSEGWPAVPGEVVRSELVRSGSTSRQEPMWAPQVQYRYQVDGVSYSSDQIEVGGWVSTGSRREAIASALAPYPLGASVQVHYDPARPERAVLEPGGSSGLMVMLVAALVAAVGPVLGVGLSVWADRR